MKKNQKKCKKYLEIKKIVVSLRCNFNDFKMKKHKLVSLDINRLHNAEFAQFINRLFEDLEKSEISTETDPDLKNKLGVLKTNISELNSALISVHSNDDSKKLALLDSYRGHDLKALRDALKAYKNTRIESEQESYKAIFTILNLYKGVEQNNYEEQTIRVKTLVKSLEDPEMLRHLDNLRIKEFLFRLEDSNTEFNKLFANRSYQKSQKVRVNIKDLRQKISEEYRTLSNYILALSNIRSANYYASILQIVNNGRNYFADILARRDGFNKKNVPSEPEATAVETI